MSPLLCGKQGGVDIDIKVDVDTDCGVRVEEK